jgi:hypothetical protein
MISKLRQLGARRAVTAVLAIGLAGGVAVPAIYAASSAGAPAASTNGSATDPAGAGQVDEAALNPAAVKLGAGLLSRVVRGDLTVRAKSGVDVNVHYERGRITAVSPTSITITGADGKGATFAVTATTKVRSKGQAETIADLSVGQNAMVFGTGSAGSYSSVLIRGLVARPAAGQNGAVPVPSGSATP